MTRRHAECAVQPDYPAQQMENPILPPPPRTISWAGKTFSRGNAAGRRHGDGELEVGEHIF
jgi:hypothetical protein